MGSYWARKGDIGVDLDVTDKEVRPERIGFVGSIKWRDQALFDSRALGHLVAQRPRVPEANDSTLTVGVSRPDRDSLEWHGKHLLL